jgi:polyhydroxyalkanoate synthesis repressor PhaR
MIEIKKYSNRRLYNTETSAYVTQDDIVELIKENTNFKIIDVESKKNITSAILIQIMLERENAGTNLVPEAFLKQIILFYENNKSTDMFAFLNGVHNFANANNIFTKGMSSFVNFNPFDLQTKKAKKENSKNNNQNTDDLVSQINSLKTQVEEIKKKTS